MYTDLRILPRSIGKKVLENDFDYVNTFFNKHSNHPKTIKVDYKYGDYAEQTLKLALHTINKVTMQLCQNNGSETFSKYFFNICKNLLLLLNKTKLNKVVSLFKEYIIREKNNCMFLKDPILRDLILYRILWNETINNAVLFASNFNGTINDIHMFVRDYTFANYISNKSININNIIPNNKYTDYYQMLCLTLYKDKSPLTKIKKYIKTCYHFDKTLFWTYVLYSTELSYDFSTIIPDTLNTSWINILNNTIGNSIDTEFIREYILNIDLNLLNVNVLISLLHDGRYVCDDSNVNMFMIMEFGCIYEYWDFTSIYRFNTEEYSLDLYEYIKRIELTKSDNIELLEIGIKNLQYDIVQDAVNSGVIITLDYVVLLYEACTSYADFILDKYIPRVANILNILLINLQNTDSTHVYKRLNSNDKDYVFNNLFVEAITSYANVDYNYIRCLVKNGFYLKDIERYGLTYGKEIYHIYYYYQFPLYYLERCDHVSKKILMLREIANVNLDINSVKFINDNGGAKTKKYNEINIAAFIKKHNLKPDGYFYERLHKNAPKIYKLLFPKLPFKPLLENKFKKYDFNYLASFNT